MKDLRNDENYLIAEYIRVLAISGNSDLIAFYVNYLPAKIGTRVFGSDFLAAWMAGKSERYALLDRVRKENPKVDIYGACIFAVESLVSEVVREEGRGVVDVDCLNVGGDGGDVIRVLEYCAYESGMYPQLVSFVNRLVAYYLRMGMLGDARGVIESFDKEFTGWVRNLIERKVADVDVVEFSHYNSLVDSLKNYLMVKKDLKGWGTLNALKRKKVVEDCFKLEKSFRGVIDTFQDGELKEMYVPELFCLVHWVLYETRDIVAGYD
jgi:hypothetical protein